MFKKIFLSAAIVVISQMGIVHHVAAMEKIPVIKGDQSKKESGLTEAQERQLIQNRMLMEEAMKQQLGEHAPQDVRDVISDKEYALALREVIRFKCPTMDQLKEKLENIKNITDQKLAFPIMDNLEFNVFNYIHNMNKPTEVTRVILFTTQDLKNIITCFYDGHDKGQITSVVEVPSKYNLMVDQNTIFEEKLPEVLAATSMYFFKPDVEFTLTMKDMPE